jgi:hypothetical protein
MIREGGGGGMRGRRGHCFSPYLAIVYNPIYYSSLLLYICETYI